MVLGSFRSCGWEFLYEQLVTCPNMFIQEFYSNIQAIDTFVPRFTTLVCGTRILTLELISKVLHVPRLAILDYLRSPVLRSLSRDAGLSLL